MSNNMTGIAGEHRLEGAAPQPANGAIHGENITHTPLLDKVASGLGSVLMYAVQELQEHIAAETQKVADNLGQRLDLLQTSFQELLKEQRAVMEEKYQQLAAATASLEQTQALQQAELASLRTETREFAGSVSARADSLTKDLGVQQEKLESLTSALATASMSLQESDSRQETALADLRSETQESSASVSKQIGVLNGDLGNHQQQIDTVRASLAATTTSLQDCDAKQTQAVTALRAETKELTASLDDRIGALSREMGVQQEDIAAMKSTICSISSRADSIVERLDKQADTLRSMYATYAQRETELEQLVDGLARLRTYPTQVPTNGL